MSVRGECPWDPSSLFIQFCREMTAALKKSIKRQNKKSEPTRVSPGDAGSESCAFQPFSGEAMQT